MMGEKKPGYRAALGLGLYLAGATILGLSGCAYEPPEIQNTRRLQMEARRDLAIYNWMWKEQERRGMTPWEELTPLR